MLTLLENNQYLSFFIALLQNIAILLSFTIFYDIYLLKLNKTSIKNKLLVGVIISFMTILVMFTPFKLTETIVFDTRSVLLSITGLFFGFYSTLLPTIVAIALRILLGGDGMYMGIAVIITSAAIGCLWHNLRSNWREKHYILELIALSVTVHLTMLACTVFLPAGKEIIILKQIIFPIILIYIPGTIILGYAMIKQEKNIENRKAKEQLIQSEYRFHQLRPLQGTHLLTA